MIVERYEFSSDNVAPICPEAWAALQEANAHYAPSYGEDRWTARACDRIREIFETNCDVYFVFTGTAANALSLAQLCKSFQSVICHQHAHVQTDECGAPEFFTGGSKLLLVGGADGKLDIGQVEALLARQNELHSHSRARSAFHKRRNLGPFTGATRLLRSPTWRASTNCFSTWTARVLLMQLQCLIARPKRSHGRRGLTFSVLEEQKTERLSASW